MEDIEFNFSGNTTGYWWMSDESSPRILAKGGQFYRSTAELPLECPFVVEGFFYDAGNKKSWHIRFHDGGYIAECTGVTDEELRDAVSFIGERGLGRLRFVQKWNEVKTGGGCGDTFKALVPGSQCFVGFENKGNND